MTDHLETLYSLCLHCDHFIYDNDVWFDDPVGVCRYIHLCDEEDHNPDDDHEATDTEYPLTLTDWGIRMPELFVTYADGLIGPNSGYYPYPDGSPNRPIPIQK